MDESLKLSLSEKKAELKIYAPKLESLRRSL